MKIHDNWCLKSPEGIHCFHFIYPDDGCEPTEEMCCWCGKKQNIFYSTGSNCKPHGEYRFIPKWEKDLVDINKPYGY